MNTNPTDPKYFVEAWKGLSCVAFRSLKQRPAAFRQAERYWVDEDADRVYVRDASGKVLGLFERGSWRYEK